MRLSTLLLAVLLLAPGTAHAETCAEERETCLETCQIDFGMEKERIKLGKCVQRCEQKKEDCHDLKREERINRASPREEVPEERRAGDQPPGSEPAALDPDLAAEDPPPRPRHQEREDPDAESEHRPAPDDGDDPPPRAKDEPPRAKPKPEPVERKRKEDDDDWAK